MLVFPKTKLATLLLLRYYTLYTTVYNAQIRDHRPAEMHLTAMET